MTNEIGENFLLYGIAIEICDVAKETYSSSVFIRTIFYWKYLLRSVVGWFFCHLVFNSLKCLQLDLFEVYDWKCPGDEALHKNIIEKKRVFKFLMGLDKDLDEVRGRIAGMKPLCNFRKSFFQRFTWRKVVEKWWWNQ